MGQYQLRRYIIQPGHMDQFLSIWQKNIVPARERVGFQVIDAYVDREKNEFMWILHWDTQLDVQEAEARFRLSPERQAVNHEVEASIVSMENTLLERVQIR
ncbi:MAG TPA: NIPSNAP family protein [Ktedonobacteraceae bacterium]|nr:NIPSNAP family protein [Ktedonobacteraceae bacterium]